MNFKILILFLFILSCTTLETNKKNKTITFENNFSNTGFALIFTDQLKKQKKISKKIEERSLVIFQKNLKKDTFVKITNLSNNKSIIAVVGSNAKYPNFYNAVISKRISQELLLDESEPYVEIKSINQSSTFVAGKAKTFDEEKNVANKAPVEGIEIKTIGNVADKKVLKSKKNKFQYIIKIGDFYFIDSAESLKKRIINELKVKKVNIDSMSKTKFRLYLGPFYDINSLKKAYSDINKLEFENIEIVKL